MFFILFIFLFCTIFLYRDYIPYIPYTTKYKQRKLKEEIEKILRILRNDYLLSMIKLDIIDRVESENNIFNYILIDGSIINIIYKDKIMYITYTILDKQFKYKLTNKDLIDDFIKQTSSIITHSNRLLDIKIAEENRRKRAERKYYEQKEYAKPKQEAPKSKHTSHPKWSVYQTLIQTVSSRKKQLSEMSKNDANRQILENELKSAESRLKLFKEKYGF